MKLLVFVNASSGFAQHHLVADGATNLLVKVFGDIGRPVRSTVRRSVTPFNFAVEIEAVVEVRDLSASADRTRRVSVGAAISEAMSRRCLCLLGTLGSLREP